MTEIMAGAFLSDLAEVPNSTDPGEGMTQCLRNLDFIAVERKKNLFTLVFQDKSFITWQRKGIDELMEFIKITGINPKFTFRVA